MDTFDATDRNSWYFGPMSRQDATEVLMNERERGVFLVRDSNSIVGDYVLCVREDTKVSNYIINKIQKQDQIVYRIGDQSFEDLPKLLIFYTLHYLDTTPLRRPALKKIEKVIGKFDFDGSDQDDLPFRRGDILTIVRKDEDQWWTAKNAVGLIGQIPVPYVQKYDESADDNCTDRPSSGSSGGVIPINNTVIHTTETAAASNSHQHQYQQQVHHIQHMMSSPLSAVAGGTGNTGNISSPCDIILQQQNNSATNFQQLNNTLKKSDLNRKLPAYACVKQARVPNAYDKTALKLEKGDIIKVTKTNINGQWEGELRGKMGHFPFTHVEFIDDCDFLPNNISEAATSLDHTKSTAAMAKTTKQIFTEAADTSTLAVSASTSPLPPTLQPPNSIKEWGE